MAKVATYLKNVGRSFGYAVGDTLESYNPVITSIARDSKNRLKGIKSSMTSINKGTVSEEAKSFKNNPNFLTNLLDDLKSGEYYNTEREERAALEAMGLDENSFSDNDEDWGDSKNSEASAIETASNNTSKAIIKSMGGFSKGVSRSIGKASAQSAEYIVKSNNRASRAIYDMTSSGFNQVSSILLDIDNKMDGLISLGKPLATHMTNSAIFYTQTTQTLNSLNESLNTLVKRIEFMEELNKGTGGRKSSTRRSSAGYTLGGMFNMDAYLDMVQKNIAENTMMLKDIFGTKEDMKRNNKNMSLMQMALSMAIDTAIPQFAKSAMQQFNDSINSAIIGGLQRGGKQLRGSSNVVSQLLGAILFPRDNFKRGISTRNYNKGPVQWDGIARKSLVEVIPTYLAKIYASLGGQEKYYDYNIGKFVSLKTIKAQNDYEEQQYANKAGGKFRDIAYSKAGNVKGVSDQLKAELDAYFLNAFRNPNGDYINIRQNRNNADFMKKYGLSKESLDILIQVLDESMRMRKNSLHSGRRNMAANFQSGIYAQNHAYSQSLNREEQSGFSKRSYTQGGFTEDIDKFNKSQSDYLRSIYQMVGNIYGAMGSSSGKKRKGKKVVNLFDPNTGTFISQNQGEHSNMDTNADKEVGKNYGLSEEEIQAQKEEEELRKNIKNAKDNAHIPFISKSKFSSYKIGGKIKQIWDTPFLYVTEALNSLSNGFNALFWGDDEHEGLVNKIGTSIDNLVEKLTQKIKDKFEKTFGNKIADKAKEGFNKHLGESMKAEWTNIKTTAKNKVIGFANRVKDDYDTLNEAREYYATHPDELPEHAYGRKITRSGLAILSEGELVIPSEYNPYYHGHTNKRSQARKEAKIKARFLGAFADGQPEEGKCVTEADENGNIRYYQYRLDYNGELKKYLITKSDYDRITALRKNAPDQNVNNTSKNIKNKYFKLKGNVKNVASDIANSDAAGFVASSVDTLAHGLKDFITQSLFGTKEQQKKEKDRINVKIGDIMADVVGDAKGAMGIGAIAGAGTSLLTGAVVGPLAGAAIGAGVGLLARSKAARDALFGNYETDDDGNIIEDPKTHIKKYKQGLLGSFGELLRKNSDTAKSTAISGATGAAAGTLLLGSPVLGLIAGSAIGFANKSSSAEEFFFGKEITAEDGTKFQQGGILPRSVKEKIQKAYPNIGAGALAGMIAGPFGLTGNILLGAVAGYATTTNQFHEFLFGDGKDKKGLADVIHDKVIGNIDGLFHNLGNQLKGFGKRIGKKIQDIGTMLQNKVKKIADEKDGKHPILGKILSGVLNYNPITLAGSAIGKVNDKVMKHNLKKGYDVYDKNLGRNMTAAEKLERLTSMGIIVKDNNGKMALDENGNPIYNGFNEGYAAQNNFNQYLANIDNIDDLNETASALRQLQDRKVDYHVNSVSTANKYAVEIKRTLGAGSDKDATKIAKLIKKGKIDEAKEIIRKKYNNNPEALAKLDEASQEMNGNFTNLLKDNAKLKYLQEKGIIDKNTDITSLIGALDNEKSLRFTGEKLEEQEKDNNQYNLIGMLHHIDTILSKQEDIKSFKLKGKYAKQLSAALNNGLGNIKPKAWKLTRNADGSYTTSKGTVISKERAERRLAKGTAYIENAQDSDFDFQGANNNEAASGSALRRLLSGGASNDDNETVTKTDFLGNVHQYTKNNQGELTQASNDNETKKSQKIINKFTKSVFSIGSIGAAIKGMGGILGKIKEGLLGSDDGKKEGLLSKLFGEEGFLGGLFRFFTNSTAAKTIKNVLAGGMGSVLSGVIGPFLIGLGLFGGADSVGEALGNTAALKGNDTESTLKDNRSTQIVTTDGQVLNLQVDENGNFITDENGNYITTDGQVISKDQVAQYKSIGTDTRVSSQLKKNIANGLLVNSGKIAKAGTAGGIKGAFNAAKNTSVTGKVLDNSAKTWKKAAASAVGEKAATATAETATKTEVKKGAWKLTKDYATGTYTTSTGKEIATKTAEKRLANGTAELANAGVISAIMEKVSTALNKIPAILKAICKRFPFVPETVATRSDEIVKALYPEIEKALGKVASKGGALMAKLATNAAKIMPAITVVYVVGKAINSWGNAESILGITKDATTGQKIIATLVGMTNALIPIIGDLIPDKTLVNIFMTIAPKLGIDVSDLQEERDEATAEVEAYNEENGTSLSIEEYNQMNGKAGIITKAKNKVKRIGTSIKEKGVVGTLKTVGSNIKNTAGKAVKKISKGIKKVASTVDDATGFTALLGFAKKGDLKGYLSYDGKDDDDKDESGIGSVVKKIPLIYTKFAFLPEALVVMAGAKIVQGIKTAIEKIKNTASKMSKALSTGEDIILEGGGVSKFLDVSEFTEDEENPIGGFSKTLVFGSRLAAFPVMLAKAFGKKVGNWVGEQADKVKAIAGKISNVGSDNMAHVTQGDIVGLWTDWSVQDNDGNPLGGFYTAINGIDKVFKTPVAAIFKVGIGIKNAFTSMVNTTKKTVNKFGTIGEENASYADKGDIEGLWSNWAVEDEDGNPLGGFYTAANAISKIGYTFPTVYHMIGMNIKAGVAHITDDIDSESEGFNSAIDALKSASADADVSGVLSEKYESKNGGAIGFIFESAFKLNKAFNVVAAVINTIAKPLKGIADSIIGTIGNIGESVSNWAKDKGNDLYQAGVDYVQSAFGTGGGASGMFVSQYDPRYQNYRVSGQKFGAKGCGPAVAAMAANAMGRSMSVSNAVSDARGYETNNGVTIDYFQKALGSKGINTDVISGGSSADMYSRLAKGDKVVLLGRDPMNTSKANSPFGPNNHYVLANGLDKNGNVIVSDPELNGPRVYSPAILNSAKVGIAGGRSGVRRTNTKNVRLYYSGGASRSAADQNLGSWSPVNESELNAFIKKHAPSGSPFIGNAAIFIKAGNASGLDPRYILAHAAVESAWGKSSIAKNKNNYFGIGAFDSSAYKSAYTFSSGLASGIIEGAKWISKHYYNGSYKQTSVNKMRYNNGVHQYCTSTTWTNSIAKIMSYSDMPANTKISYDPTPSDAVPTNLDVSTGSSGSTTTQSLTGVEGLMSGVTGALTSGFSFLDPLSSTSSDSSTGSSGYVGDADTSTSSGGKAKAYPTGKGTAQSFVDIAKSQLGVVEGNTNITDYGKFMGMDGQAWCAAFVSWCMDKAFNGDKNKVRKVFRGNESASVQTLWDNFRNAGAMVDAKHAQAGDVVIYKNGTSHTGIVEAVDADGKIHTIEGNTSSGNSYDRNGGMVNRKQYYPGQRSGLTGFGRPNWSGAGSGLGFVSYDDLCSGCSGSNSALLRSRAGSYNARIRMQAKALGSPHEYYGGASNIADGTANILNTIKSSTAVSGGSVSRETVGKLLESISNLLNSIANNTAPVEKIYNLLSQYYAAGGSSGVQSTSAKTVSNKKTAASYGAAYNAQVDSNIEALAGVLAELAKG